MPLTTRELLAELSGTKCRCGRLKQPRNTFCRICFYLLPQAICHELYRRIFEGYEEAYAKAAEYLDSPLQARIARKP